jgi:death-on-curing protein
VRVVFLALDEVLAMHADLIERHGGHPGIRDAGLLESALAAPAATFGGHFLHGTPAEMAAASLHGLVRNHPFVDGNKRAGLMAAFAFLGLNGFQFDPDQNDLTDLVLGVAAGTVSRAEVPVFVQRHARRRSRRPPGA